MSRFLEEMNRRVLVLDGAMGTSLQAFNLPLQDYDGLENCSEILNVTRPDVVKAIHESYLEVGCDAVETNTFGATRMVLAEFGLEARVRELNLRAVAIAREACDHYSTPERPRFVVGSVGPGTKLVTLGHTTPDILLASYREQAEALLEGGVDAILVETCQDPLQCKIAVQAMTDAMDAANRRVPLIVQVTVETTGTMLVGTEIAAVVATLARFPLAALGMNCATGPREMTDHLRVLANQSPFPISVLPNAGLPELVDGKTRYPLSPSELARWLARFADDFGVGIVGGCCGTTAAHLAEVVKTLGGRPRKPFHSGWKPSVSSLYRSETLSQDTSLLLVGERTNSNGSRQFKRLLEDGDVDGMVRMAREQTAEGSHVLDVCVAYVGRDEVADMEKVLGRFRTDVRVPLMIDTTETPVMERALAMLGGRCIVNSVNLEDGEGRCDRVMGIVARHGAAVVALTIDEQGMAKDADRKLAVAKRLLAIAEERHGLRASDILFDPLTFTVCTGNEDDRRLALETLDAIERIRREIPDAGIILGVSNVSFGLKPAARHILNSVFLKMAHERGLTAAIVHSGKILPLNKIAPEARQAAEDLILDRRRDGYDPLERLIALTEDLVDAPKRDRASLPVDERLKARIVDGDAVGLDADLREALASRPPLALINDVLLDGMKTVGELFAKGDMQLPFVLRSAETMKAAVAFLEPFMEKSEGAAKGTIVLATVRGDVHDIGKNLVDIILTNNGYKVHNLGIKQPLEPILEAATTLGADAVGLSGLLVKSTVIMKENLEEMAKRGVTVPVVLGGAALTRNFVECDCRKVYGGRVDYARDAFDGLKFMADVVSGTPGARDRKAPKPPRTRVRLPGAESSAEPVAVQPAAPTAPVEPLRRVEAPRAPFLGTRILERIPAKTVAAWLNEWALFRVQWQVTPKGDAAAYEALLDTELRPRLRALLAEGDRDGWLMPAAAFGWYPAGSDGDTVVVFDADGVTERERFRFPRQSDRTKLCLADYLEPLVDGRPTDVLGVSAVTVGKKASERTAELFAANRYQDYLYAHGLAVELAEATAEYVHARMRADWGIAGDESPAIGDLIKQRYRGRRYSPGYPACPDLGQQEGLFRLLGAERIGLSLTEGHQIEPEQSTSAFVFHHPQATYFST